jgi:hypothetical protein
MGKFADAVREFEAVQDKYDDFGAADTEPRYEFYALIRNFYRGRDPKVPTTIDGWQLYRPEDGGKPGAGKAARALAAAARKAMTAGRHDLAGMAEWLGNY